MPSCRSRGRTALRFLAVAIALVGCDADPQRRATTTGWSDVTSAWFTTVPAANRTPGTYDMREAIGGGVALLDADGDGRLDVYQVVSPPPGQPPAAAPNRLWMQVEPGRFIESARERGAADPGHGQCVATGDVNGDGAIDLFVGNYGDDVLLINNGDGTFAPGVLARDDEAWTTAATFFDHDGDGDLDLFVVHYVQFDPAVVCQGTGGREFCGPEMFAGTRDRLFLNDGSGHFTAALNELGMDQLGRGLGVACTDLTGDGRVDIYVANDGEANHLWVAQPDGTYREEAVERGAAYNGMGTAEASMGVALADVDGDAQLDVFLTHLVGETNTLLVPRTGGVLLDRSHGTGLSVHDLPTTGFGCAFADFDHDGRLDLAIANGRVKRGPAHPDAKLGSFWNDYAEPDLVFPGGADGRFAAPVALSSAGSSNLNVSRGLATGDLDGDGDLDLVVGHLGGSLSIYRNDTPRVGSHWLRVRVHEGKRPALGALVTLDAGGRVRIAQVVGAQGFASSSEPVAHFGLGSVESIDGISVRWADGKTERFRDATDAVDRTIDLVRGTGTPR